MALLLLALGLSAGGAAASSECERAMLTAALVAAFVRCAACETRLEASIAKRTSFVSSSGRRPRTDTVLSVVQLEATST